MDAANSRAGVHACIDVLHKYVGGHPPLNGLIQSEENSGAE